MADSCLRRAGREPLTDATLEGIAPFRRLSEAGST